MKKECNVLGFQECTIKESGELMFRICISVNTEKENYYGKESTYIFLPQTDDLKTDLKRAIDNKNLKTYYTTTDNIITGKTKVNSITIE